MDVDIRSINNPVNNNNNNNGMTCGPINGQDNVINTKISQRLFG